MRTSRPPRGVAFRARQGVALACWTRTRSSTASHGATRQPSFQKVDRMSYPAAVELPAKATIFENCLLQGRLYYSRTCVSKVCRRARKRQFQIVFVFFAFVAKTQASFLSRLHLPVSHLPPHAKQANTQFVVLIRRKDNIRCVTTAQNRIARLFFWGRPMIHPGFRTIWRLLSTTPLTNPSDQAISCVVFPSLAAHTHTPSADHSQQPTPDTPAASTLQPLYRHVSTTSTTPSSQRHTHVHPGRQPNFRLHS